MTELRCNYKWQVANGKWQMSGPAVGIISFAGSNKFNKTKKLSKAVYLSCEERGTDTEQSGVLVESYSAARHV